MAACEGRQVESRISERGVEGRIIIVGIEGGILGFEERE